MTEPGKDSLPSWLHYDEGTQILRGIPGRDDVGNTVAIEVQAVGQFSNDTQSHAKAVFGISVVEDSSHTGTSATPFKEAATDGMKPIKCPEGSSVTMVTIIIDTDLSGLQSEEKVGMLHGLCSHLSIPAELPRLMPVGNRPMFDSSALVAGPGDVKRPNHPGAVLQWEVGCGIVNANHMPVLQTVEATAHDGSMSNAVGHGIIGWHVTNNKIHAPHRMKRQAAIQPTPTLQPTLGPPTHQPVPTIVIDEVEHPPTRVVPTMASPSFAGGEIQPSRTKHKHHPRTKTRGRHHKHPKHSPTKKHHHHKTKYPKTPMPTPTVMPIVPTRVIDVTPTVLDTSMERPQPTMGVLSPSMTSTAVLEPSIHPGIPPMKTAVATEVLPTRTYIVPEVSTEAAIRPTTTSSDTSRPTDEVVMPPKEPTTTTTTTTSMPKPTEDMEVFNYAPILKNDIDRISVIVGDVLSYKVPKDTFYDFEDGDTENLKLVFLTVDGLTLPRNSWVRFNQTTQTLYGLALPSHEGRQEYLMAAIDRKGKIARDAFEIVVQRRPKEQRINHEFSLTIGFDYRKFLIDVDNRIDVANKIAALYGDENAEKITVTKIEEGSVVYAWTNNSLPTDKCPSRAIENLLQYLITPNKSLNPNLVAAMKPYEVKKASTEPRGVCALIYPSVESSQPPPDEPGRVETAPRETSDEDVLITMVVPAIVIAVMLLLAGLIGCFLYRKKRMGKLSDEDHHTFVNKGIPIIFADELEEKPDPPTKPLILDDEKPPLPPPGYRRSSFGSAPSTPNSDHKEPIETTEDEREDNDMMSPLYQPPPPFTTGTRDHRQPRPRMQHTYRNPPPYVPP